jgi:hypothetical protein
MKMGPSAGKVVLISLFLVVGMLVPGIIWQPNGSLAPWSVKESDFPQNGSSEERMAFLLNYAILAPSIYNTQPWRFDISSDEIMILADESRWLKAADSNKREMYSSIGGAIENLIIAADHFGYSSTISYFPKPVSSASNAYQSNDIVARVSLQPGAMPSADPRLFSAITPDGMNASQKRTESPIEQESISRRTEEIAAAIRALNTDPDISIILLDDPKAKERLLSLTEAADRALYSNITFKSELGHWLSRGGMGPAGVQAKIAQAKVAFLDSIPDRIEADTEIINNSPFLGIIASKRYDRESQVRAGRLLERISLLSSHYGLGLEPMSQALQWTETESRASGLLAGEAWEGEETEEDRAADGSILYIFCLKAGTREPTPRRPLEEALV